jgi:hypothetical protein
MKVVLVAQVQVSPARERNQALFVAVWEGLNVRLSNFNMRRRNGPMVRPNVEAFTRKPQEWLLQGGGMWGKVVAEEGLEPPTRGL